MKNLLIILILVIILNLNVSAAIPKVGIILPETGDYANLASLMRTACELAAESFQQSDFDSIEIVFADNYNNPDSARVIAERLVVREDVVMLVGGYPDECCAVVAQVAAENYVPYLVITTATDGLTQNSDPHIFSLAPPASENNTGFLDFLVSINSQNRHLVVVYDEHTNYLDVVTNLRSDFKTIWQGQIDYLSYQVDELEFQDLIGELVRLNPEIVCLVGNTNSNYWLLRLCREADWTPQAFVLGTIDLIDWRVTRITGSVVDYLFGSSIWNPYYPYPGADRFVEQFNKRRRLPPDYRSAEAYASVQVVYNAIKNAVGVTRESVRESLMKTDLMTVFGRVKFEDYNGYMRQNRVTASAVQLLNNEWIPVSPQQLAKARYVYPLPDWSDRSTGKTSLKVYHIIFLMLAFVILVILSKSILKYREK